MFGGFGGFGGQKQNKGPNNYLKEDIIVKLDV